MSFLHGSRGRTVRPADERDRVIVSALLEQAAWKHQHLDWYDALELLDRRPYLLAIQNDAAVGCLACPPDLPDVGWVRVFAVKRGASLREVWLDLWQAASPQIRSTGSHSAAALPSEPWFPALLEEAGFSTVNEVIFMEWRGDATATELSDGLLRPMKPEDVPAVATIDHQAFDRLWRLSDKALSQALSQAASATVAERGGRVLGYQMSTAHAFGAHLARLAVAPAEQRRGLGRSLAISALQALSQRGYRRITVNTQRDNLPSLRLYERLGFRRTGQDYPVYELEWH